MFELESFCISLFLFLLKQSIEECSEHSLSLLGIHVSDAFFVNITSEAEC